MSQISTHVLDLARGRPAAGIPVRLERRAGTVWTELGHGITDGDGRVRSLLAAGVIPVAGTHRIHFELEMYFRGYELDAFYPEAAIVFEVRDPAQSFHVPLLLSPFGYSTYRGS